MKKGLIGVTVAMLTVGVANAQSETQRIEAVASIVVHEERCELKPDAAAISRYIQETFDSAAEALSNLRLNTRYYESIEGDISGLDKELRCAAIRQFAEDNGLLLD